MQYRLSDQISLIFNSLAGGPHVSSPSFLISRPLARNDATASSYIY